MRSFTRAQHIVLLAIGFTALTVNLLRPSNGPFGVLSCPGPQASQQWAVELPWPVRHPGIYTFEKAPTTYEAIQRAGGVLTPFAPQVSSQKILRSGTRVQIRPSSLSSYEPLFFQMSGRKKLVLGIPIDVNEATTEELALVPGIGEGLARRIAEFRGSRSAFKTWYDLRKVKGVGPANIRAFRDFLQIGHGKNLGPSGPKACLSSDQKE
jgi:competence protein ComEA